MPDEIERRLREVLIGFTGNDDACEDLDSLLEAMKERDRRISETLEEMLQEVEDLILLADGLDEEDEFFDDET